MLFHFSNPSVPHCGKSLWTNGTWIVQGWAVSLVDNRSMHLFTLSQNALWPNRRGMAKRTCDCESDLPQECIWFKDAGTPNHSKAPSFVKRRLQLQQVSPRKLRMQQINSSVWAPLLGCLWSLESLFLYLQLCQVLFFSHSCMICPKVGDTPHDTHRMTHTAWHTPHDTHCVSPKQ